MLQTLMTTKKNHLEFQAQNDVHENLLNSKKYIPPLVGFLSLHL
jgi:hypothetical protein